MNSANLVCITPTIWIDPTKVESIKLLDAGELWQSFSEGTTHVVELTMQSGQQEFFEYTDFAQANAMMLKLINKLSLGHLTED